MVAMVAFVFLKIFFFVDINKPTEEAHDIIFKHTTSEKNMENQFRSHEKQWMKMQKDLQYIYQLFT